MKTYPLMLDLTGRLAVVIGGGPVALRKAAGLLEAEARVRIVCPDPIRRALGDAADWIIEPYRTEHLDGASLVFAAATPEVNARVVVDAKTRGIWVNSADEPDSGDFLTPAAVRKGELLIAVSTGGSAPAVAKQVRELLDKQFDDAWATWLEIHRELRPVILQTIGNSQSRRIVFDRLADLAWIEQLRREGRDAVSAAMRQVVEEACGE